jgi:hypothetical protein
MGIFMDFWQTFCKGAGEEQKKTFLIPREYSLQKVLCVNKAGQLLFLRFISSRIWAAF